MSADFIQRKPLTNFLLLQVQKNASVEGYACMNVNDRIEIKEVRGPRVLVVC